LSARLTALVSACGSDNWAVGDTVLALAADWPDWRVLVVTDSGALDDLAFFDGGPRVCGVPGEIVREPFSDACRRAAEGSHAVLFLAAGDEPRKGCAEVLVGAFGPTVGAVFGDYTEAGRRVYCEPFDRRRMAEVPWLPRAPLVSSDALRAVGPPSDNSSASWLDFWFRLTEQFVVVHAPQVLSDLTPAPAVGADAFPAVLARAAARA
jgi:hypothetical protein